MKKMIILIVVILVPGILTAQPPGKMGGRIMKQRREQMEMLRIWKMTDELELTEKQAEKFFPRLRSEDGRIEELENQRQTIFRELHQSVKEGKINANELDAKIDKVAGIETEIIRKRAEFLKGMDGILSTEQRAKFMVFRHRFKARMMDMMQEAQRRRPGQNKRNNR